VKNERNKLKLTTKKRLRSLVQKNTVYVAIVVVIILFLVGATLSFHFQKTGEHTEPKAAIIDQLSSFTLTDTSRYVNQTLMNATRTLLLTHFPEVDYYSDNATVDNYRNLPSEGYKLIIWRAHSALNNESQFVAISASDIIIPNLTDYDQWKANGELEGCNISGDPRLYLAITPKFITEVMSGRFVDTVIIFMSCNGLKEGYTKTAEALQEKGAKAIVSWNGWIENPNNDEATALLLNYLFGENDTIQQAVDKIPEQSSIFGPSRLSFFPANNETAQYRIPNYNKKTTTNNEWFGSMFTMQNAEAEPSDRASHEPEADSVKFLGVLAASKLSKTTEYEEVPP
jgi:hypothetical protein